MSFEDGLQNLLRQEFISRNLIPELERYEAARQEISHIGIIERENVINSVGITTWRRTLARFKRPYAEDDCVRILGFGNALTGFAVAPLNLSSLQREAVSHLGALANFIVSTFDHLVDLGNSSRLLLPRQMLELASRSKFRSSMIAVGFVSPAASRMMNKLVMDYFRGLEQLTYASKHASIHKRVRQTVLQMYDVENKTLKQEKNPVSERTLRRKAALPFVVMGLAAWLEMEEICPQRYWRHLRWLYRLGDFFGWIDDIADWNEDLATGHPNRLLYMQTRSKDGFEKNTNLAHLIAQKGERIVHEWERQVNNPHMLPLVVREGFYSCLVSWLGGTQFIK